MNETATFDGYRAAPTPETLLALLRTTQQTLYNLCYQILRHPQDAEDAVQKVLVELLNALPGIQTADHFKKWVYRTSYHVALAVRKARRRRRDHERRKGETGSSEGQGSWEDLAAVHASVFALEEDDRALIIDHYFENRSLQSLADEVGCSKVAIWKRLEKVKEILKRSLAGKGTALAGGLEEWLRSSVPVRTTSELVNRTIAAKASIVASGGSLSSVLVLGGIVMNAKALSLAAVLVLAALLPIGFIARRNRELDQPPAALAAALPGKTKTADRHAVAVGAAPVKTTQPPSVPSTGPAAAADDEPRGPIGAVGASIKWFVGAQNRDGSWGQGTTMLSGHPIDKVGTTGLALLAFLGAGYTTISADRLYGVKMGDVVQNGIRFLLQDQREDGSFQSSRGAIEQAVASLALVEAYGMSGSRALIEPAKNGLRALQAAQLKDGSWGDLYESLWSSYVLVSGKLGDLPFDPDRLKRTQEYFRGQLDAGPNLPAMIGALMVEKNCSHPAIAETARWVAVTPPDWSQQDFGYWYMGSMALFQYDGPEGPLWKSWSDRFKQTLVPTQQKEGNWSGSDPNQTLVQTALGSLSMQVNYRFANIVGSHK